MKRKTRAQLEAELANLRDCLANARLELQAAQQGGLSLRKSLDDVKERLAFAEAENQRMRGYIERVSEDDVVREPLIQTGDPEGAQQFVPKRKPTIFAPQIYSGHPGKVRFDHDAISAECSIRQTDGQVRRHWVTY